MVELRLRAAVLAAALAAACAGREPAPPPPPREPPPSPCERLVRCCQAINRDDAAARAECADYLREPPATCAALRLEVRRRYEGVLPVACR